MAARSEFGLDLVERNAAGVQQHQQMVNDVGGFPNQAFAVVTDSRNRGLDGFLAELLGALVDAAIEQLGGIGPRGALAGSPPHAFSKTGDREFRILPPSSL